MAKSPKATGGSKAKLPSAKTSHKPAVPARKAKVAKPALVSRPTGRSAAASAALIGLTPAEARAVEQACAGKATLLGASPRARDATLFIAAARLCKHPVLVASPLAAELYTVTHRSAGVEVVGFGSFVTERERNAGKKRLLRGGPLLVVVEPAQLFDAELRRSLAKIKLGLLGIAAAHACSEHAHEIAPAYLSLREAKRTFGVTVLATCTRTTERVLDQVCEAIGGGKSSLVMAGEPKVELHAQVVRAAERRATLLAAIARLGVPGIVLTATVQEADSVFAELSAQGMGVVRAHAGMAESERAASLERFRSPRERLVLVTLSPHGSASGLAGSLEAHGGLGSAPPRADLAFVVHYQAPLSTEQHFEDMAWLPPGATSLVLADSSDAALVQALLAQQRIKPAAIEAVAQALAQAPADRPAFADTLALRAGTSRRSAERVLSALGDRNLLVRDGAQISRRTTPEALTAEARLLSARFAALRAADAARAEAVARYVTSRHEASPGAAAARTSAASRGARAV